MSKSTRNDIKTLAYVLRRTNYGEADRILNIITPNGKMSAIAKGARKEKSKLAGGIEMFSLVELNIHEGKSDLYTITSAKMLKYYNNLLVDLGKMELVATILKKVSLVAEHSDSVEYFKIVDQTMKALNSGITNELVETWFYLNFAKATGEQVNLFFDLNGDKLSENERYSWDTMEGALFRNPDGEVDAGAIKSMRLMLTVGLDVSCRVKGIEKYLPTILRIARAVNKI